MQTACAVLIFVSNECDSLCALRIVTVPLWRAPAPGTYPARCIITPVARCVFLRPQRLLQTENVPYKVKPVASYDHLLRAKAALAQEEVRGGIAITLAQRMRQIMSRGRVCVRVRG